MKPSAFLMRASFLCAGTALLLAACSDAPQSGRRAVSHASSGVSLEDMVIVVPPPGNRAVSFTNKRSAFYYTPTHRDDHPEHSGFRGLNIAKRKIFSGYELAVDGTPLNRQASTASVYPQRLERAYPAGVKETLRLFDHRDLVDIQVDGAERTVSISLLGEQVAFSKMSGGIAFFSTSEDSSKVIAIGARARRPVRGQGKMVAADANAGGFYIAVAGDETAAQKLLDGARVDAEEWSRSRKHRMEELLSGNAFIKADDDTLTQALRWIMLTMDQLVTRQQGEGIYAGLPWFNEYWGRDSFISLPGATLVTGQFETARNIFISFAAFQDRDPDSEFYGRMPNIVNPELVDYHTTDGTPRFAIELEQYVMYSGDTTLVRELYPAVQASIEGSIRNWTDERGYLIHADNETWMDARRSPDLVPYSPRGTRANDIQALWHQQLAAGARFAAMMGDEKAAEKWQALADQIRSNFRDDFRKDGQQFLADRLEEGGHRDFRLRPNQLFALDMIDDPAFKTRATRVAWEELVYPWGVASLDRHDPFFHPYHIAWEHYHKDQAYHNGTVWLWLNGIAMQRMIEVGQKDLAFRLFQNMNRDALTRGVVGGLAENSDAYPHPGERVPRLTGTYLQAWSNAEHLRVWYQCFLGIRPDMTRKTLRLAPRIPDSIDSLEYTSRIGSGRVRAVFQRGDRDQRFTYSLDGVSAKVDLDIAPYEVASLGIERDETLVAQLQNDSLQIRVLDAEGSTRSLERLGVSSDRLEAQQALREWMDGVRFAVPLKEIRYPVFDPPTADGR